ncbi:MAG: hypothetical protein M3092_07210 [Actinomycetia bacterium]|nr:hypothetical protein [Actinomycetes bacterium]
MRIRVIAVLMGLVLIASACSSSDSEEATADTGSATTVASAPGDTAAPATTTTAGDDGGETAPPAGGNGTATVTLDNGESYTFSILCGLETQEVAGVEILFTAVSYDEPLGFDVTQFGDGGETLGAIDDLGTISIYDSATFDDVWGAGSLVAQLSQSEFSLDLNGSTITGSGLFFTGEDVENLELDNGVPGELVANCG